MLFNNVVFNKGDSQNAKKLSTFLCLKFEFSKDDYLPINIREYQN